MKSKTATTERSVVAFLMEKYYVKNIIILIGVFHAPVIATATVRTIWLSCLSVYAFLAKK